MGQESSRRAFLQQTTVASAGMLLLGACTSGSGSSKAGTTTPGGRLGSKLPPAEGGQVLTDPALFPKKFSESPDFAQLVAQKKLPPVEERIGQDPLVIKPVHSIGKYGGEIRRGYITAGDTQNAIRFCAGPDSLLYFDYTLKKIVPNIAKGYEVSKDAKVVTLHLRRGMKWSDGQPFGADDIVFWYEEMFLNKEITSSTAVLAETNIRKVDDHTVEYVSKVPRPLLPLSLACAADLGGMTLQGFLGMGGFAPKHYISKFHPKYSSEAAVTKAAAAAGFKSWPQFLLHQNDWTLNRDLPTVTPWIMTRPINTSPWTFAANPYSVWVDSQGNQLPYIPKITMRDAQTQETLALKAVAGEYDFQDRNLRLPSLPVLLKNQKRSGYTIHRAPRESLDLQLRLNLSYVKDPVIGDLIRNVDFRRALSLGIDRDAVNQTFFLGTSVPTATMVSDDNPYFPGPQWRTKWATHDPAQANKLLDKIGLTKKDSSGLRLRPDGKGPIRLEVTANKSLADFPAMCQLIGNQWKSIGIQLIVDNDDINLIGQKLLSNTFMINANVGGTERPFINMDTILPVVSLTGPMAIPYAKWHQSGGKDGIKPPASMKLLVDAMNLADTAITAPEKQRIQLGRKILMLHADQVWSIGVLGFGLTGYGIYYAKNNMGNVPGSMHDSDLARDISIVLPMTFYYK